MTVAIPSTEVRGRVVTTDTKTSESRVVAIDGDTAAALRSWQAQQANERLRAGEVWVDSDLVFTWQDGSGVTPDYLSKEFVKAVARVNQALEAKEFNRIAETIAAAAPGLSPEQLKAGADRELAKHAVGLPRLTLHGTRHSHACTLLRAGVPVHVVAARLGHADSSVTLRVYSHAIPTDGTAAAAVFQALMGTR